MLERISEKKVFICDFRRLFCYFVWNASIILTIQKQSLLLGYTTIDHFTRYSEIRAFSNPYFPVYGHYHIGDFTQILENTDTILFINGDIQTNQSPYLEISSAVDNYKWLFVKQESREKWCSANKCIHFNIETKNNIALSCYRRSYSGNNLTRKLPIKEFCFSILLKKLFFLLVVFKNLAMISRIVHSRDPFGWLHQRSLNVLTMDDHNSNQNGIVALSIVI